MKGVGSRAAAATRAKKRHAAKYCQAPDRDVPALTCGYPLPCPFHNARRVIRVAVVVGDRS